VRGYEDNLGEPLRAVREDVEKAWVDKFDAEVKLREEKEAWADELVKQLEKEKKVIFLSLSPSLAQSVN
jgi:centromeric protein E